MFKKLLALFIISVGMFSGASAFNVTFKLDLNGSGLSNPSVNGTFNGWCGYCAPMSDVNSDGIWEITIPLNAGNYEYKFTANSGQNWEILAPGGTCTVTSGSFTNRLISISGDTSLSPVCFGSCLACSQAPPSYPITFKVDMSLVGANFTTPTVNGTFNGWSGNANPMTDANSDGIWETTINLPAGTYEYKFAYDNWVGQENLTPGSSCTITTGPYTNRTLAVSAATTLPVVCWGSCLACSQVQPSYTVTFRLNMQGQTGFNIPEVNGTFNGWCGNCNAMSDLNGDNIWETTVTIPAGNYEYKFSYDTWTGQENLTPSSSCTMTTGANTNRTLNLTANTILDVVCWGSCTNCVSLTPGCTDPIAINYNPTANEDDGSCIYAQTYNVTFQVDMQNVTGFTTPEVNGTFNEWCGGCAPMTDANGDNIWELTVPLLAGSYEFKYAYDNWAGQEALTEGSSCTTTNFGFTNRTLNVNSNVTLPVVCWASCTSCEQTPVTYNVTFQVDMQNVSGFTTPEINGTFNNWCGGCFTMTDVDGDNIWEGTTQLAAGTYEFKYAYDAWAGSEQLTPGDVCTITVGAFTNRLLTITDDVVLPVVCWASCVDCGSAATPVDVTFKLDMQYELGLGFTTPEINGSFNNWCGGCAPMSDADGDNVWEITIPLIPGTYEYKFAYDNWAGQEAMVEGSTCTITTDGFTNRVITVIDAETLAAVCWESCTLCPDFVNENSSTISVYPNPSNGSIRINSNMALPYNIEVFDLSGRKVQDMKMFQNNTDINLDNLAKGAYQIRVSNNYNSVRETVIIK